MHLGHIVDEEITPNYIFRCCVFAPLWEELAFRHAPILIAKEFGIRRFLLPVLIISSILFGYLHGGPENVLIQGIYGFIFACVYVKNDFSYRSSVIIHSMWNIFVTFFYR